MLKASAVAMAVLVAALAGPTAAASFNCAKAKSADEKTICADRALNDSDVKMAVLYDLSRHFSAMGKRGMLEDEQTAWLHGRRQCGANKQCLSAAYEHRLQRLQGVMDEVAGHGPF